MAWREKKYLQCIIYIVVLVFIGWLGYTIIYGKGGIIERRETQNSLSLLEEDIRVLEHEIERIDLEIKNIKSNKKYITGLARELGYKQDGEIIFRFLPKTERAQD
jgi:cell division protein FtsB